MCSVLTQWVLRAVACQLSESGEAVGEQEGPLVCVTSPTTFSATWLANRVDLIID